MDLTKVSQEDLEKLVQLCISSVDVERTESAKIKLNELRHILVNANRTRGGLDKLDLHMVSRLLKEFTDDK